MPVQLPLVPSVGSYEFQTNLDDTQYFIVMRWNARAESWFMSLYDEDQDLIRANMRVVLGASLGLSCTDSRFPQGIFLASDLEGTGVDAGFDDLGERVQIYFYTAAEFAAL